MKLSRNIHRRGVAAVTTALVAVGLLVGCADAGTSGETDGELQDITVGVLTSLDVAPIYLGEQKGFFEEEGLNVTFEVAQGGAALVPAVVSGQYQFGFSNLVSIMVARDKGLPLQLVIGGSQSTNEIPDYSAVLVAGDSPMQSAADLEGKTVAVNTLGGNGELTIRQSVRVAGGDPDLVNFIELTYQDMIPAVANGTIDGAFAVEPFVTLHEDAGNRPLAWNFMDVGPNTLVAGYFTTESTDQALVDKFVAAMAKSLEYAQANPDEIRAIIPTFSEMSPELIAEVLLPKYPVEINLESVEKTAELAYQDGFVTQPVDLDALVRD